MANRERKVQLHFMVTEKELSLIQKKMEQMGTRNLGWTAMSSGLI